MADCPRANSQHCAGHGAKHEFGCRTKPRTVHPSVAICPQKQEFGLTHGSQLNEDIGDRSGAVHHVIANPVCAQPIGDRLQIFGELPARLLSSSRSGLHFIRKLGRRFSRDDSYEGAEGMSAGVKIDHIAPR